MLDACYLVPHKWRYGSCLMFMQNVSENDWIMNNLIYVVWCFTNCGRNCLMAELWII